MRLLVGRVPNPSKTEKKPDNNLDVGRNLYGFDFIKKTSSLRGSRRRREPWQSHKFANEGDRFVFSLRSIPRDDLRCLRIAIYRARFRRGVQLNARLRPWAFCQTPLRIPPIVVLTSLHHLHRHGDAADVALHGIGFL
jgi:hypothetical protein